MGVIRFLFFPFIRVFYFVISSIDDVREFFKSEEKKGIADYLRMISAAIVFMWTGYGIYLIIRFVLDFGYKEQFNLIKEKGIFDAFNDVWTTGTTGSFYKPVWVLTIIGIYLVISVIYTFLLYRTESVKRKVLFSIPFGLLNAYAVFHLVQGFRAFGEVRPLLDEKYSNAYIILLAPFSQYINGKYESGNWSNSVLLHRLLETIGLGEIMGGDVLRQGLYIISGFLLIMCILCTIHLCRSYVYGDGALLNLMDLIYCVAILPLAVLLAENIIGMILMVVIAVVVFVAMFFISGGLLGGVSDSGSSGSGGGLEAAAARKKKTQEKIKELEFKKQGYDNATKERLKGTFGYGYIDPKVNQGVSDNIQKQIDDLKKDLDE